jgi:hypothetical protein
MKRITVTFTTAELALLRSLATDQLFRREFIDPRLPGYSSNSDELALGKQLVERLRLLTETATGTAPTRRNGTTHLRARAKD